MNNPLVAPSDANIEERRIRRSTEDSNLSEIIICLNRVRIREFPPYRKQPPWPLKAYFDWRDRRAHRRWLRRITQTVSWANLLSDAERHMLETCY